MIKYNCRESEDDFGVSKTNQPVSPKLPVDKIISLRLECGTCRSSRAVSIESDELYCKIHKENRNKFCIYWNPSRYEIKAYLSD